LNGTTPYESWNALFSNEMLELVLKWTNTEIERYRSEGEIEAVQAATYTPLSMNELKAFLGLL